MKKWMVLFIALVLALVASAYLFTNPAAPFSARIKFHQAPPAVVRALYNSSTWEKWWPGKKVGANHFRFGDHDYRIVDKGISSIAVMVSDGKYSIRTSLDIIVSGIDSIALVWSGVQPASSNPVTRLSRVFDEGPVQKEISELLGYLQSYYAEDDNLYGMKVSLAKVVDTALVSTAEVRTTMPSTADIYRLLDRLESYIKLQDAAKTGNPMLNISRDGDSVLLRVAIPVNKRLPDSGAISYRWMLPGGHICVAEYRGGPLGAMHAVNTVETFLKDHDLKQPAIPYQSLVTDRRIEPDTSKWITRIYCPFY